MIRYVENNSKGTIQPGETLKFACLCMPDDCDCEERFGIPKDRIIFGVDTKESLEEKKRKEDQEINRQH